MTLSLSSHQRRWGTTFRCEHLHQSTCILARCPATSWRKSHARPEKSTFRVTNPPSYYGSCLWNGNGHSFRPLIALLRAFLRFIPKDDRSGGKARPVRARHSQATGRARVWVIPDRDFQLVPRNLETTDSEYRGSKWSSVISPRALVRGPSRTAGFSAGKKRQVAVFVDGRLIARPFHLRRNRTLPSHCGGETGNTSGPISRMSGECWTAIFRAV